MRIQIPTVMTLALLGAPLGAQVATPPGISSDSPILLSPFEVVSDARGYYASNTMSGTRLNSKIEDLGASITVVTRELPMSKTVITPAATVRSFLVFAMRARRRAC